MTTQSEDQLLTADLETKYEGSENKQLKDRWKQGYKTGRRSACTDMAMAIEHDLYLRQQISTAVDPFEFLATWIRNFTKGTE
jgi:hypothetical protein